MSTNQFNCIESISDFLAVWLRKRLLSEESQAVTDQYYANWRNMQSPRMKHWYENQLLEITQLIKKYKKPRVLEVGIGTGTESLWFAMLGADVTGIDAFPYLTSIATERLNILQDAIGRALSCTIKTCPLLHYTDSSGFDLIWLEQAFHHLEPRKEVANKLAELLRPGGNIVFSEANALNPFLQMQLLRFRGTILISEVNSENGKVLFGNERILTAKSLTRELSRVKIRTKSVRYYRIFPSSELFKDFLNIEKRISNCAYARFLAPIFTHYNLVAEKEVV